MTIQEFSDQFDTLANSYSLKMEPGEQASRSDLVFDEYEKSVFLTKGEEEIVLSLYTGKNAYGESLEDTEELRRYLSSLVMEDTPQLDREEGDSYFYMLPEGLWFIIYEKVVANHSKCGEGYQMEVVPIRHDEFHKVRKNPFRGANGRRALRLDAPGGMVEIVCKEAVTSYCVRYVRKPRPILLVDLPDGMSINGESTTVGEGNSPCELHEALHQRILERAVAFALQSKGYKNNVSK